MTKELLHKLAKCILQGTIKGYDVVKAVEDTDDNEVNKAYWLERLENEDDLEYYASDFFMEHGILA